MTNQSAFVFDPSPEDVARAMKELELCQRILDYDTKEFTIELLVQKLGEGGVEDDFYVPEYQRAFTWELRRQARFIESLLIGLPIPFLFFGDTSDGRLEIVDGNQRLSTCRAFLGNKLELVGLEKLPELDGFRFRHLSASQQRRFKNRTIRSVVLSEKATDADRRDLFDRINTGSLIAKPVEIRRGAISGPVTELVDQLALDETFLRLCPITEAAARKREAEELVTRFLVFTTDLTLDSYRDQLSPFIREWIEEANARAEPHDLKEYQVRFDAVMQFVDKHFPHGFAKTPTAKTTPRGRFEAIAVGVYRALKSSPEVAEQGPLVPVDAWLGSDEFFAYTTSSAANVRSKILRRQRFVERCLLATDLDDLRVVLETGVE